MRRTVAWLALACCATLPAAAQMTSRTGDTAFSASSPGFDVAAYPGDAAMTAWRSPSSPYRWVGYYLAAPCRRDTSWVGKRATLARMGWGLAAIYVGEQDWTQHARATSPRATSPRGTSPRAGPDTQTVASRQSQPAAPCSSSLLSSAQGVSEAADAVAKMRAEGFAEHSTVFLDIELVATMTPAFENYYKAWVAGVIKDGHYRPGVYVAKANALAFYDAAIATYRGAGRSDAPSFWVASVDAFADNLKPSDVGFAFAQLWQGQIGVSQIFNGVRLTVDVNLATSTNPSSP